MMAQRAAPSPCARILAANKPAFAMEAPVGQPEVKRRRLRAKTTVAQVAVALVAAAASVQAVAQVQWAQRFLEDEDLSAEEDAARKAVYLVTLPHPGQAAQGTQGLRAPDSLTREQVVQMILDAVAHPAYQDPAAQSRHGPSIRVEQMVVYRELHAPDEQGIAHAHFHIALRLSGTARYVVYKRALRLRHNVASHWSCSHQGYWSAVRYGFSETPRKPAASLDAQPLTWSRSGPHPPLFEASQEPNTAAALARRRVHPTNPDIQDPPNPVLQDPPNPDLQDPSQNPANKPGLSGTLVMAAIPLQN